MSLADAGFSGTLLQVAATIGITVGGYLSDRVARRYLPRRMLLQCLCYFAATPFLLAFLGRPGFAFLAAGILLFSFLRSVGQANEQPILCDLMAGYLKQDWGLAGIFAGVSGIVLTSGCVMLAGCMHSESGRKLEVRSQPPHRWWQYRMTSGGGRAAWPALRRVRISFEPARRANQPPNS